jgi:hypothetical protein
MKQFIPYRSKVVLGLAALAFTVAFGAGVALAQSPHFLNSKTSLTLESDGDVTVKWKESGLGDNLNIDYTFSADASITCVCVTNSNRCPSAANKATFSSAVSDSGTFAVKNGSVNGSLTITAPECPASASPTCGGGQHFVLSSLSYTNISLSDDTNNILASGLPASLGPVTGFTCP